MMDLATLEETNRLRVEMGMKPLPVPGQAPAEKGSDEEEEDPMATLDGRHGMAYDNFKKAQEAELAKRRRDERAEAVKREREKAQRHALLSGTTLAEESADADDTRAWLRGQKKRQKKIARSEEEAAAAAAAAETARRAQAESDDLAGVTVGHDVGELLGGDVDGGDQILTLRDATVLENEEAGDELENVGLREREKLQERLDLKKRRPGYDPLTEDDATGNSRSVLGHYDDKQRKTFTLDPTAVLGDLAQACATGQESLGVLDPGAGLIGTHSVLHHVDLTDILGGGGPSSDYAAASKPKKEKKEKREKREKKEKKRAIRRRGAGGGDDGGDDVLFPENDAGTAPDAMDVDGARKRKVDTAIEDDDDSLQALLALQRRQALQKRRRMRPEDLAKQLRAAANEAEADAPTEGDTANTASGLVIDETAEFLSNLRRREDRDDDAPRPKRKPAEDAVTAMDAESSDEDVAMGGYDAHDAHEAHGAHDDGADAGSLATGLEAEKTISSGMGATLAILRGRGILSTQEDDESTGSARNARLRQHQAFIAEKRLRLAALEDEARRRREQDRAAGGALSRMTAREREEYARRQNAQRELQTSRMLSDMFAQQYTPNFDLTYTDEHGRSLNQKEAFRELSHGFHGKTSGRGKTDKMLKKIAAEKRHMAEGILDASEAVGMSSAAAQQLKKRREAGVRLD